VGHENAAVARYRTLMSDLPKLAESSLRWWDFYFVRYALGTIVGGIVVFALCCGNRFLIGMVYPLSDHLAVVAVSGLAYCYVASAPILVFHAGRFLLKDIRGVLWWGIFPAFVLSVVTVIFLPWLAPQQQIPDNVYLLYRSAVLMGVFVFCLQIFTVWRAMYHGHELWTFYKKLSERREIAIRSASGIVESYRHLREHGNSFVIVFLEILLGIILVVTSMRKGLINPVVDLPSHEDKVKLFFNPIDERFVLPLVILVAWILPAAFVWVIGTQFERQFSEDTSASRRFLS